MPTSTPPRALSGPEVQLEGPDHDQVQVHDLPDCHHDGSLLRAAQVVRVTGAKRLGLGSGLTGKWVGQGSDTTHPHPLDHFGQHHYSSPFRCKKAAHVGLGCQDPHPHFRLLSILNPNPNPNPNFNPNPTHTLHPSFRFDGRVVAKLPFVPLPIFQKMSHRNLEGNDPTDCSMVRAEERKGTVNLDPVLRIGIPSASWRAMKACLLVYLSAPPIDESRLLTPLQCPYLLTHVPDSSLPSAPPIDASRLLAPPQL